MAVSGVGNGAAIVYNTLLVQRSAPDHLRGRAFSTIISFNFAVLGAGMIAAGPLTDAVGARWVFGAAGVFSAASAVVGVVMVRGVTLSPGEERVAEPLALAPEAAAPS
jgi:MFS family permease